MVCKIEKRYTRKRDEFPQSPGPLEIQTTDGSSVLADITILYRFYSEKGKSEYGKHGGPAELLQVLNYEHKRMPIGFFLQWIFIVSVTQQI